MFSLTVLFLFLFDPVCDNKAVAYKYFSNWTDCCMLGHVLHVGTCSACPSPSLLFLHDFLCSILVCFSKM